MGFRATIDSIMGRSFDDATGEERAEASRKVIAVCSFASAGLVLQPLPGLEHGIILVQVGMVVALAHVHGERLSRKRAREVIMDLGAVTGVNLLGRQAATTLAKVVLPGIGGALAAPSAFGVTWATGYAAQHYFATGGKLDRDKLKAIFEREKQRSRRHYSKAAATEARPDERDLEGRDG